MRFFALLSIQLMALALVSCGDGGSSSTTLPSKDRMAREASHPGPKAKLSMPKRERARLPPIVVRKQNGLPSKHLVVHDLRAGTGAPVSPDDAILVSYFSAKYGEAAKRSRTGGYGATKFGMNEVIQGWMVGLPGMKVGGRRELIVPPKLGYRGHTLIYVIDLLAVYPGGAGNL